MKKRENELYKQGYKYLCGIDEAGRGPLAGPVVAAAVIFDKNTLIPKVNDSKKLSHKLRLDLYHQIRKEALTYAIGVIDSKTIDQINILKATFMAMKIAVSKLKIRPDYLLIDGRDAPFNNFKQEAIIKGDSKVFSIAAASILAKVTRDQIMTSYAKKYPIYDFENNFGYGTKKHTEAIIKYGRSKIHRKSFKLKFEKDQPLSLF